MFNLEIKGISIIKHGKIELFALGKEERVERI